MASIMINTTTPSLAVDVPDTPAEALITKLEHLHPVATSYDGRDKLTHRLSTSTLSSTLSSPVGRRLSRASYCRGQTQEFSEESIPGAGSSGELEDLIRRLHDHMRDSSTEINRDMNDYSPSFQALQNLRRMRSQDLVSYITRLRLIGQGGYGRVYQGMWQGAVVAIKFLVTDSPSSLERSITEAVLSKIFMHPHVVQTFACSMISGDDMPLEALYDADDMELDLSDGSCSSSSMSCSHLDDESLLEPPAELDGTGADPLGAFVSGEGFGAPMPDTNVEGHLTYSEALGQLRVRSGQFVTQIVMEYCDRGSLQTAINKGIFKPNAKWGQRPAFRALLRTAREVVLGMAHIHMGNVVHGDLKPANVLLKGSRVDRRGFQAKVADFGLARVCEPSRPNGPPDNAEFMGTVTHMAPEALAGQITKASDVYSFGIMLWEMYNGEHPYAEVPPFAIMVGVQNGTLRPEWSDDAPHRLVKLSKRCWDQEPSARPSFEYLAKKMTQIELQLRQEARRQSMASSRRASAVSDCSSFAEIPDIAAAEAALTERHNMYSPVRSPRITTISHQLRQSRLSSSSELPSPVPYRQNSRDDTLAGTTIGTSPFAPHGVAQVRCSLDVQHSSAPDSSIASSIGAVSSADAPPTCTQQDLPGLSSLSPFTIANQHIFEEGGQADRPGATPELPPAPAPAHPTIQPTQSPFSKASLTESPAGYSPSAADLHLSNSPFSIHSHHQFTEDISTSASISSQLPPTAAHDSSDLLAASSSNISQITSTNKSGTRTSSDVPQIPLTRSTADDAEPLASSSSSEPVTQQPARGSLTKRASSRLSKFFSAPFFSGSLKAQGPALLDKLKFRRKRAATAPAAPAVETTSSLFAARPVTSAPLQHNSGGSTSMQKRALSNWLPSFKVKKSPLLALKAKAGAGPGDDDADVLKVSSRTCSVAKDQSPFAVAHAHTSELAAVQAT